MSFLDLSEVVGGDFPGLAATEVDPLAGRISRAFVSEAIAYIDYDPQTEELLVTFTRGGPYVFTGVPSSVVEGWLTAESPGRYYHAFIKAYA
jgi:hypothetical protein